MTHIDWGNMALAAAALLGMAGVAVFFGVSALANKPPRHEPRLVEPSFGVFRPRRRTRR